LFKSDLSNSSAYNTTSGSAFFVGGALLLLPGLAPPDSAGRDCTGDWTGVVRTGGSYKRDRVGNGSVRCIKQAEVISCGRIASTLAGGWVYL
jgi:hypothetical protein